MKPLPSPKPGDGRTASESMPSLPSALPPQVGSYSKSNRRVSSSSAQRAYPWLLLASTTAAAVFCMMYVTKPVIVTTGEAAQSRGETPAPRPADKEASGKGLLPSSRNLPGESAGSDRSAIRPPVTSSFEETNLRVQHILSAEAPGGHASRIDLEVPVLYQSRNLRWTHAEVAEARELLVRLTDYQEKSRSLRSEGVALMDAWNSLIERSLPTDGLRADSPSLPFNQSDSGHATAHGITTAETIALEQAGK